MRLPADVQIDDEILMAYRPNDFYARKAKAEDFAARSVYKLQEMDTRFGLLKRGASVLDLGASPGSWSQYAAKIVGEKGCVVGLDLQPVTIQVPNAHFLVQDAFASGLLAGLAELGFPHVYHVVLSDMAPATTGIRVTDQARSYNLCACALGLALDCLTPSGNFVCKMFDNPDARDFRTELQQNFAQVDVLRPKSTRKESTEVFFIARGRRNHALN